MEKELISAFYDNETGPEEITDPLASWPNATLAAAVMTAG